MNVVFMGTPEFAVPTLEDLIESEHEVKAIVTQPDKPKGRSGKLQFPPVKEKALAYHIPVLQPVKIKEASLLDTLSSYQPDVIVVAAYGQILPETILDLPKYGCLCVHASLLPKLRGAAPIQWAVINGEKESGVTIIKMDKGIDTGDIIRKRSLVLAEDETGGSLHDKLSLLGGPMILETLTDIGNGIIKEEKQNEEESSYATMLTKQMGNVDFQKPAVEIERQIRGLNPWPSAYMHWNGRIIKIWRANAIPSNDKQKKAGEIVLITEKEFHIQTGEGILSLVEVQMEGKRRMAIGEFLRGNKEMIMQIMTSGEKRILSNGTSAE